VASRTPYWTGLRAVALLVAVFLPFAWDQVLSSSYANILVVVWVLCCLYAGWGVIRHLLPPFFGRSWRR
jgi:hypothetical protein